jgi:hypothetical protein
VSDEDRVFTITINVTDKGDQWECNSDWQILKPITPALSFCEMLMDYTTGVVNEILNSNLPSRIGDL